MRAKSPARDRGGVNRGDIRGRSRDMPRAGSTITVVVVVVITAVTSSTRWWNCEMERRAGALHRVTSEMVNADVGLEPSSAPKDRGDAERGLCSNYSERRGRGTRGLGDASRKRHCSANPLLDEGLPKPSLTILHANRFHRSVSSTVAGISDEFRPRTDAPLFV
ncbi:unnamed protein product [Lampetra planeri]